MEGNFQVKLIKRVSICGPGYHFHISKILLKTGVLKRNTHYKIMIEQATDKDIEEYKSLKYGDWEPK